MRSATTLLLVTGALLVTGCSLLIDAQLDEKGASSGSGGQGGGLTSSSTSSSSSSSASTSAGATMTTSAAQGSSGSSGGCGPACVLANAMSDCVDGKCVISACDSHFADCDLKPETGCETNLNNDAEHCGACDHPCSGGDLCAGAKCK